MTETVFRTSLPAFIRTVFLQGSEGAMHQFVFHNLGRVRTACKRVKQIRARGASNIQSGSA